MNEREIQETRGFWNRVADDWLIQVGQDGDNNRILNSDPVLWDFAGDVAGLAVLDAGCGTGYLTKQLHDRGARVTGVDFSERMIAIACEQYAEIEFRVDSCAELHTIPGAAFDLLIANYVLMDTPDLEASVEAFHRILRPGGVAVLVFSHPCFPQARRSVDGNGESQYGWSFSYFERTKCIDPPWDHFTSEFIWYHRPLSDYWKAFTAAGFKIEEFEEPRITEDRYPLATNPQQLESFRTRPMSVAFKLRKGRKAE